MNAIDGAQLLVTGGTGSFGREFIRTVLGRYKPKRVVIFSRDELKQYEMRAQLGENPALRFFIGDVRDRFRLERAFRDIDIVIHAAALKQVDTAEYNPFEYVATNITGSQNVVEAALNTGVKRLIALSTDKASSPINLYGATKLVADKMFQAANNYSGFQDTKFSVVRYGNVMGSRGSVVPFYKELARLGRPLPVTDPRMTRFWITLDRAVDFVLASLEMMQGGEIFVPKIPSMRISDLTEAIAPGSKTVPIPIRPGEKLHEEMISLDDSRRAVEFGDRFIITPTLPHGSFVPPNGKALPEGFVYRSDLNADWLSQEDLRILVGNGDYRTDA